MGNGWDNDALVTKLWFVCSLGRLNNILQISFYLFIAENDLDTCTSL